MIKIGIIGTGYWGKHHLRIFSQSDCELVGIADLDKSKKILADQHNVRFFTDYRKLINLVDAVSIVTPPSTHFDIARYALENGKHVLVEKPFVLKINEGKTLINLAGRMHMKLLVGHVYLYHPAIVKLKKIIDSKALGKIYYFISQRLNLGIVRSDVNSLWNFAPHDLSIINYLLGKKAIKVCCLGQSFLQKGIEDITFLTLYFSSGEMAHIVLSWLHPAKVRELTVVGSKKMAVFDDVSETALKVFDKGVDVLNGVKEWKNFGEFKLITRSGDVEYPLIKKSEPLKEELNSFIKNIEDDSPVDSDGQSGLSVLAVLEAATKSLKEGGKIVTVRY